MLTQFLQGGKNYKPATAHVMLADLQNSPLYIKNTFNVFLTLWYG